MVEFSNTAGTLVTSFTIGVGSAERTLHVGAGDPNDTGPPSPANGDLFLSDGTLWQFDGTSWSQLETLATNPPNFSFRVIDAGSLVTIPAGQQMIVHSCGELEGEMAVEGQMILEL